jgi:RNA polymerase sigma factor (sigma-70 family)
MPTTATIPSRLPESYTRETRETAPAEVRRLLAEGGCEGQEGEAAWMGFLAVYSGMLMEVAVVFAPGYDGALDRYAYILDELRRHRCRRLRHFVADGRGRFSTWLSVVAKRLCLDHYRRRYGRAGRSPSARADRVAASQGARRRLAELTGSARDLELLEDPAGIDPCDALVAAERKSALALALARLPAADQVLLRLRYEENLSARAIAGALGFPTQFHVYRRLTTLCDMLRSELEEPGGACAR